MSKSIVFYHPKQIKLHSDRASEIRVEQMLRAFKQTGYKIITIAGSAKTRHRRIKKLKTDVANGLKVEFVYGETTNAPIALADKKILPTNLIIDYRFFAWLKNQEIPRGVFYRDIFWKFDIFKQQLPFPFNILLKPLYWLDWFVYDKYWELFFLPSESMNLQLPSPREHGRFKALPPGFNPKHTNPTFFKKYYQKPLKLLYIGGIEPTLYDLTRLLNIIVKRSDVTLKICCRKPEWLRYKHLYQPNLSANITIVHAKSNELSGMYREADLFAMLMPKSTYMEFAAPVKFFESIGHGLPMISFGHEVLTKTIIERDIGWVIEDLTHLDAIFDLLISDMQLLKVKRDNLKLYRDECTWKTRQKDAIKALSREISSKKNVY